MKKITTLILLLLLSSSYLLGKTLVTVNGHAITDALLAKGFNSLPQEKQNILIEQLIKEEVIHADLLKSSIVQNVKFQEAFEQQKNMVEQKFGKALNAEQLRSIKGSIAVALYQQEESQKAFVDESEIKAFYDNNPNAFVFPNSIEIANIIVQDEATAKQIHQSLQGVANLDEAFVKAANAQKQNGYMGWFSRDAMPTNLFDKAYKYKKRTLINAPVKTKHGYNIVYLLNKKSAGKLSYSEAKAKIEQILKQKKALDKLKDRMQTLYGKAEIVY